MGVIFFNNIFKDKIYICGGIFDAEDRLRIMIDVCFVQLLDHSHFHLVFLPDGSFKKINQIPKKLCIFWRIQELALEFVDDNVLKDLFRHFAYFKHIFFLQFLYYVKIVVDNFLAVHSNHIYYFEL